MTNLKTKRVCHKMLSRLPLGIPLCILALTGCTNLFLFPDHHNYFPNVNDQIVFEEGNIPTPDGQKLDYWFVPAQEDKKLDAHPKGLVIQVHGNAQNLTSHVRGVGWLTKLGYHVATFDYRGYGQSTGHRNLFKAYQDTRTALDYFVAQKNPDHLPVYFYGQSLGGTLLLKAVSRQPGRWHPAMIVIESAFDSYSGIAREKLAATWLTWPLQGLAYVLVSDRLGLRAKELNTLAPTPVVLFYSEHDPIVPLPHGERIFADSREPKKLYTFPEPGHVAAMWVEQGKFRKILLEQMASAAKPQK